MTDLAADENLKAPDLGSSPSTSSHGAPLRPARSLRRASKAAAGDGAERHDAADPGRPASNQRDYQPIDSYSLIGNLRTSASVCYNDASLDFMCWPHFDSPSIFCRLLDAQLGGHFSIHPSRSDVRVKQAYLPNSCVLRTKYLSDDGVVSVVDFMHRPHPQGGRPLRPCLVRRVEGIRGKLDMRAEIFPAFDYARQSHTTELAGRRAGIEGTAVFRSKDLNLEVLVVTMSDDELRINDGEGQPRAPLVLDEDSFPRQKGPGVTSDFAIEEGQIVTFVFRTLPEEDEKPQITAELCDGLLNDTLAYWQGWIHKAQYNGRWRGMVHRSAFALKLLIFEPTGAICAAPTFSLPESIGGTRQVSFNSLAAFFSVYALIRLGFVEEAGEYMRFMTARIEERKPGHHLPIMFRLDGSSDLTEETLDHLEGYRQSRPVRIGNGAAGHVQLDIYGELLDAVYLYQKFGRPLGYDAWRTIRELVDWVVASHDRPDSSIWEVRSQEQYYVYSRVMVWVAIDRGLRLADKRSLPCPNRLKWLQTRDQIYEDIQTKGWNAKEEHYCQSFESPDVLDSSCLIMPLVFFCDAGDPRFLSTLKRILRAPEKGGLTANSLVFRYDVQKAQDGIEGGGEEGSFNMCTLWSVEAMARAGKYDPHMLDRARRAFEEFCDYSSHTGLYAEEISRSGEALGNSPQAFTHVSVISTAYNLNRQLGRT